MSSLQVNVNSLSSDESNKLFVNAGTTLQDIMTMYNVMFNYKVDKFYNFYGQVLPLTYQIQKTMLDLYVKFD